MVNLDRYINIKYLSPGQWTSQKFKKKQVLCRGCSWATYWGNLSHYKWSRYIPLWGCRSTSIYDFWRVHIFVICIRTWNPNDPCFDWKRHCFGGFNHQNRGQTGSRCVLNLWVGDYLNISVQQSQYIFFLWFKRPSIQWAKKNIQTETEMMTEMWQTESDVSKRAFQIFWWFLVQYVLYYTLGTQFERKTGDDFETTTISHKMIPPVLKSKKTDS